MKLTRVNGQDFPWEEGLVIKAVLQRKNFTYPAIIVAINGVWISEEEFETASVKEGDDVQVIHLIAGG